MASICRQTAVAAVACIWLAGCSSQSNTKPSSAQTLKAINDSHIKLFGDFELPRKVGSVINTGLQIPVVSPDGKHILYLHTDADTLPPITLLGGYRDPKATLSIYIRPTAGTNPGRPLSKHGWSHSAVWSDSGNTVAYVANEPPISFIVHVDIATGKDTRLGVPNAINCMPRFDTDDQTIIFCSADSIKGPFRIYRQRVGDKQPTPLTPAGSDLMSPIVVDESGETICIERTADRANLTAATPNSTTVLVNNIGPASRFDAFSGIATPVSPDRANVKVLHYDTRNNCISILNVAERKTQRHRTGSIAACWLTNDAIALATGEHIFAVNTKTGMSPQLLNGMWIPCRYVPDTRKLILLGRQSDSRLSIYELQFKADTGKTHETN